VGEICCGARAADGGCSAAAGGCESGLREYRDDFIAPLASILAAHATVPVVLILEPDSLPNLVTNRGSNPRCGSNATQHAYEDGISLALAALKSAAPRVTIYLDAGHGAWLGWEEPARRLMARVCELGLHSHIRGFSTNVANYNPLGVACPAAAFEAGETAAHWCHWVAKGAAPCCSQDLGSCGRQLLTEYSSGAGELMYAQLLSKLAREQCAGFEPRFVIDTSRNGNPNARHAASYLGGATCNHWCNLRGARLGLTPTTDTGLDIVDAYFWVKTPGESDGCGIAGGAGADTCARVDASCARPTAMGTGWRESPAPDAGAFFAAAMLSLNSPLSSLESGALGPDALGKMAFWLLAAVLVVCACGCGKTNHARPLVRSGSGAVYAIAEDQPMLTS
jgi:cellulose 1,4-beta-cellobiosidase